MMAARPIKMGTKGMRRRWLDVVQYMIAKGKGPAAKEKVGEHICNRGVYTSAVIAEAIRKCAETHWEDGGGGRGRSARTGDA
jgi:hypothetical protein